MHEHDINVQTFLGSVSAQVDHKPLNSDELEVRIHLKKTPQNILWPHSGTVQTRADCKSVQACFCVLVG